MNLKKIISSVFLFTFLMNFGYGTNSSFSNNNYSIKNDISKPKESMACLNSNQKEEKMSIDSLKAQSYILTDYKTGQVLYEKNADEKLSIASITKIMLILLVVEDIKNEKISLDELVTVSENAKPSQKESTLWLEVGEKITVSDLLKGVIVNSGNDGARTLAERIAGSEQACVELMNKRAKELGMKNTHFMNASGLDQENSYSTARDVSIMAKELLKHKWITNYSSIDTGYIRNGKLLLSNTNKLLKTYKGCNGLKTGTDTNAGHCLCATAVRNGMHLCAVSLKSESAKDRWHTCSSLLDYGFNNFQKIPINYKEIEKKELEVEKGKNKTVGCMFEDKSDYLIKKTNLRGIKKEVKFKEELKAPIKKGDVVGDFIVKNSDGKQLFKLNIVADEDVEKLSFWDVFSNIFMNFFGGVEN